MRKFLFSLIALLVFVGVASAQIAIDPENGPVSQLIPVYNNASATVTAGDVVIWDIDASTGNDDFYVTTTTDADSSIVAGVVWPNSCATKTRCTIAVWGTGVTVNTTGGPGTTSELCTSGTAGKATQCSEAGDPNRFGQCTGEDSSNTCKAFINVK